MLGRILEGDVVVRFRSDDNFVDEINLTRRRFVMDGFCDIDREIAETDTALSPTADRANGVFVSRNSDTKIRVKHAPVRCDIQWRIQFWITKRDFVNVPIRDVELANVVHLGRAGFSADGALGCGRHSGELRAR